MITLPRSTKRSESTPDPPLLRDLDVRILAPYGRDSNLIERALRDRGLRCDVCHDPAKVATDMKDVGALLLTAEALTTQTLRVLNAALNAQPCWSNMPVILVLEPDGHAPLVEVTGGTGWAALETRAVILNRPVNEDELVDTVRSALASRARQYVERNLSENLEEKLVQRTARLRAMALDLTRAEKEERRRLAHLLHDDLQQLLFASKMHLDMLNLPESDVRNRGMVETAVNMLRQSIDASRSLAIGLSPPILELEGLVGAIHWLSQEMKSRHRLRVTVRADQKIILEDPDAASFLFEATRELLFNTVKHANVDEACVTVTMVDAEVRIAVEDHGAGLPARSDERGVSGGGFGLSSIRTRLDAIGGSLKIATPPQGGCRITLCAPARVIATPRKHRSPAFA